MNSTSANTFSLNGFASRVMIAGILWRLSGSPVANYVMTITDVEPGSWYAETVRWAASEGIASGPALSIEILTQHKRTAIKIFILPLETPPERKGGYNTLCLS